MDSEESGRNKENKKSRTIDMKHLRKFNESEETKHHDISECFIGHTHVTSDTNINFVIDGEEYGFTLRESGDGDNYTAEFLPDHDLPFELTEELKNQMYRMYDSEATR